MSDLNSLVSCVLDESMLFWATASDTHGNNKNEKRSCLSASTLSKSLNSAEVRMAGFKKSIQKLLKFVKKVSSGGQHFVQSWMFNLLR